MKRTSLLAAAGVLAVVACKDQPTQPRAIAPSRTVVSDPSFPAPRFYYTLSEGKLTLTWNWGDDQPWDLVSFDLTVSGRAIAGDWNVKPYAVNARGAYERYGFSWSGTGFQSVPQACVSVMAKNKSDKGTPTTTYHAQNCEPVEASQMHDVPPPHPTQIAAGSHFSCALAVSGEAYCWGYNAYGQLGDGTTTSRNSARPVAGGIIFRQISAGGWMTADYSGFPGHACAITAAGVAYCWGHNGNGQLGDGTNVDRHGPVPVAGGLLFSQISVGAAGTCGVTTTGDGYCWGWNYYGQVGDGTTAGRWTPTLVAGGHKFVQISTGGGLEVQVVAHTCGVTTTGQAYCWGANDSGELGNGTHTVYPISPNPTPVAVLGGLTFQEVSAGVDHTCGVTTSNAAYCWGGNGQGQLGNGWTGGPSTSPSAVGGGSGFTRISAGDSYTCGLSTTSGIAYCWGYNDMGKLGSWSDTYVATPVQVIGPIAGTQISAGDTHACAVNVLGQAFCWGGGAFGELGTGTSQPGYQSVTPARVRANPAFRQLTAGYQHVCGLDGGGRAYCWGNTTVTGQPGDGTTATLLESGTFTEISAGAHHTCGLSAGGGAACWGWNTYGQLGDGTTTDHTSLKPIFGFTFSHIDGGNEYTCAVTAAGASYCWGANDVGQLGDGTTTNRYVPTLVTGSHTFRTISAGKQITCALEASGPAYCWGIIGGQAHLPSLVENGPALTELTTGDRFACGLTSSGAGYCWGVNSGNLGDGTTSTQPFPKAVVGGLTFSQISAGFDHTCAVTGPGAAYCWGWNLWGQNGDGTTTTSLVPTAVSGGLTFDKIVGGGDFSCGRATTGVTYCWGANAYGQLGDGTTTAHLTPALVIGWLNVRT